VRTNPITIVTVTAPKVTMVLSANGPNSKPSSRRHRIPQPAQRSRLTIHREKMLRHAPQRGHRRVRARVSIRVADGKAFLSALMLTA
jgi:hypothetical protein